MPHTSSARSAAQKDLSKMDMSVTWLPNLVPGSESEGCDLGPVIGIPECYRLERIQHEGTLGGFDTSSENDGHMM